MKLLGFIEEEEKEEEDDDELKMGFPEKFVPYTKDINFFEVDTPRFYYDSSVIFHFFCIDPLCSGISLKRTPSAQKKLSAL